MIVSADITGTINPPNFRVSFEHSRKSRYSASDITKLPVETLKAIQLTGNKETVESFTNEAGILNFFCSQKENVFEGFFTGEVSFFLEESVIQTFDCEGEIFGYKILDEYTFIFEGRINNNSLNFGTIEGDLWFQASENNIQVGEMKVFTFLEESEKVIISPTTKAVPDVGFYPKVNTRNTAYLWRESVDRELLSIKDEMIALTSDYFIENARSFRLKELYGGLLKCQDLNLKPETLRALWRATVKIFILGNTIKGLEESIKVFTGTAPTILTYKEKNLFKIGSGRVGRARNTRGIIYNTVTIKVNNDNGTIYDESALKLFIENVKPKHLRVFLVTEKNSYEIF